MKKESRRTLFFLLFINRGFTNLEGVCSFFLRHEGETDSVGFPGSDGTDRVPRIQHSANCSPFYPPLLASSPSSSHTPRTLEWKVKTASGEAHPTFKMITPSGWRGADFVLGRLFTKGYVSPSARYLRSH